MAVCMDVCMAACMAVCMAICMAIWPYAWAYACPYAWPYVWPYVWPYGRAHGHMHGHLCGGMHGCMNGHGYGRVNSHMYGPMRSHVKRVVPLTVLALRGSYGVAREAAIGCPAARSRHTFAHFCCYLSQTVRVTLKFSRRNSRSRKQIQKNTIVWAHVSSLVTLGPLETPLSQFRWNLGPK